MKAPTSNAPFFVGIPAMIWQVLFFYLPLVLIVVSSFVKITETGAFEGLTLDLITHFFKPLYLKVILSSILLALSNTIICLLRRLSPRLFPGPFR